jgi:toxin FitB
VKYLLDTCVISETMKPRPDFQVITWLQSQDESELFLSALTFGELAKGIAKIEDATRREKLNRWVNQDLKQRFIHRVLPIDTVVCERWGAVQGKAELVGKPMPALDGLIAACGLSHGCIVVTRNVADMQQSGVELFNPWLERED